MSDQRCENYILDASSIFIVGILIEEAEDGHGIETTLLMLCEADLGGNNAIKKTCAQNILTVRSALRGRGVELDESCPWCNAASETLLHVFVECGGICDVWTRGLGGVQTEAVTTGFLPWLSQIIATGSDEIIKEGGIRALAAGLATSWNGQGSEAIVHVD
nr:leucine-rich repeat protein [Ipomoea batatas]